MMPKSALEKSIFSVETGEHLEREFLETCLVDNGFTRVNLVEERGDFSVRGDIVDLFQPGSGNPVRIEFFGDVVESIRDFDSVSQVSIEHRREINILPVREICLTSAMKDRGIQRIIAQAREQGCDPSRLKELTEKIEHLGSFSGIEQLAPFFYEERENLFDYLADQTLIVLDEEEMVHEKCQAHHDLALTEFENAVERGDVGPVPDDFYCDPSSIHCIPITAKLSN